MTSQQNAIAYQQYLDNSLEGAEGIAIAGYSCHKEYWQDGCTESRVGMSFEDYYRFRPEQSIPRNHNHVMYECQRIYNEHGIVRNIIDLMVDFTTSNIRISHPQPNIQRMGRKWFKRVRGMEISTQFNLGLYLFGTAIVDPYLSKLTLKQKRQLKDSTTAKLKNRFETVRKEGRVPYKYTFLNPVMVQCLGGPLNQFIGGEPRFGIKVPYEISQMLNKGADLSKVEREIIESIPSELKEAMKKGDGYHYFELDRPLEVYHYRKHDWQQWSTPIIMSIYRDLRMLEQAQLADMTALDAASNQITILKLGSLEHQTFPNKEAFSKLKEAALANTGGGPRLIIWGPDIDMIQSKLDIAQYLDPGKYEPIMERIYGGLGIPPSMTGNTNSTGSTNNLVSLKGFIERLVYGRTMLCDFWNRQLSCFSREMDIKTPFQIEFDIPNLGDEESEKKLYIELNDRGIVSDEFLIDKFGGVPSLEAKRVKKEHKSRLKGTRVRKGGPYNNPERPEECIKNLVEQGKLPVDELGIKSKVTNKVLTESDTIKQEQPKEESDTFKQNRRSTNGRPPGAKDQTPRKPRNRTKPIVRASTRIWAKSIQKDIARVINPVVLQTYGKKNMRSLTSEESKDAEYVSIATLFNLDPAKCSESDILEALSADYKHRLIAEYFDGVAEIEEDLGRKLTMDERRDIAAEVYSSGVYIIEE